MPHFARTLYPKKRLSAWTQFLTFLSGILMGLVELIPGVGIATLSITFNLYHAFIDFLHDVTLLIKEVLGILTGKFRMKPFKTLVSRVFSEFNLPLLLGILFGLAIFSFIFRFILVNLPSYINAIFFGVILASFLVPLRQIKKVTFPYKIIMAVSALLFYYVFGWHSNNIFYVPSSIAIFISGFLSPLTLVLPGMGGSFALVLLNSYSYFLNILNNLFFSSLTLIQKYDLALFIAGFTLGFVLIIGVVKQLLKKYKSSFMAILSGVMLASLRIVYPFITIKGDIRSEVLPLQLPLGQSLVVTLVVIASFFIGVLFNKFSNHTDPVEDM